VRGHKSESQLLCNPTRWHAQCCWVRHVSNPWCLLQRHAPGGDDKPAPYKSRRAPAVNNSVHAEKRAVQLKCNLLQVAQLPGRISRLNHLDAMWRLWSPHQCPAAAALSCWIILLMPSFLKPCPLPAKLRGLTPCRSQLTRFQANRPSMRQLGPVPAGGSSGGRPAAELLWCCDHPSDKGVRPAAMAALAAAAHKHTPLRSHCTVAL